MDKKMKDNKVKVLVRLYVEEALAEIFKKIDLEKIVEKVVREKVSVLTASAKPATPKRSVREVFEVEEEVRPAAPARKKITAESLGISDDVWKNIYADTLRSGNPILNEVGDEESEGESATNPEHVPENVLERMGLMRDYSKHIGMDKASSSEDEEWNKLRLQRQKMLNEAMKR